MSKTLYNHTHYTYDTELIKVKFTEIIFQIKIYIQYLWQSIRDNLKLFMGGENRSKMKSIGVVIR